MKKCNCHNCNCFEKHPEGVQVTIEILENLPEDFLKEFKEKSLMYPNEPSLEIWKEIINNWFDKKIS